jgi:uncharacterized protein (DUF1015 family)
MVSDFFPFPGLRYRLDALGADLDRLIAPPYDVIDAESRAQLEAAHPRNAVHLILPRDRQPGDGYRRAAEDLERWRSEGTLAPDSSRLYLYVMDFTDDAGRRRQTRGVVGALQLPPPGTGRVLPHERTLPKPRGDRLELLRAVRANLDPVWLLSLAPGLPGLLEPEGPPLADCRDSDGVGHLLYALEERAEAVAGAVSSAPLVIADGHHRYETALAYQEECRAAGREADGGDRIMAMVVGLAGEDLCVGPIHRLLADPGPELRERLSGCFTITPAGANTPEGVDALEMEMAGRHQLGLVDSEGLALLAPRGLDDELAALPEPLRGVDAVRLELALGRCGPFELGYNPDARAAAALVAKGAAGAAVLLRPPSVAEIDAAAEAGVRMPEKTSYFWPKPRTGLVFRVFD